jgi:hypothetical protein
MSELTREEKIIFGKICGCGMCQFCWEWHKEQEFIEMDKLFVKAKLCAEESKKQMIMIKNLKLKGECDE